MARKRVSLKDKGPETLGLTEKKGQGIDVLFGGPTVPRTRSTPVASESKITNQPNAEVKNMATENKENLTNSMAVSPESLPVNEADNDLSSVTLEETDELGLPVAMEAPPANLAAASINTGEVDELGLPVAMDAPPTDFTMSVPPSAPPPIANIGDNDLSGLADDNDLSGLAGEDIASPSPATELPPAPPPLEPGLVMPPVEPVPPAPTFIPAPEVPVDRPMPAPPPIPTTYTPPTYAPPPPPVVVPAPVAVTPPPPPPVIESFGGIVAAPGLVAVQNVLPPDLQWDTTGNLQLAERAKTERDERISEQVARYIGQERREALDKEIERLYEVVSNELSDNNEDVSFALKTLSEAQDIVLEDIRQYDEALYRVAMVKTMLVRRRNLKRWSYTWGSFVFFYAVAWLVFFISAIILTANINSAVQNFAGQSGGLAAASTAWYSALAGGIGGVIGILYSLYWRVAVKQNFDRQYLMYYLVQPIMGFMLGAVTHLIITAGFLTFNAAGATSEITVILQMVIGFIAGFRQRVVYEMIDRIVQKIAPDETDKSPTSVVPE
jgi:hypothetical protein